MTTADLICALETATPEQASELVCHLVNLLTVRATATQVETLRTMLQIGDRFTSTRPMVKRGIGVATGGDSVGVGE